MPSRQVHICFGDPKLHLRGLRPSARTAWTINARAARGDVAAFYMIGPMSAFVATGVVASDARKIEPDAEDGYWHGYQARVERVRLLPDPVPLSRVRAALPRWAWLRQPRRSTVVPDAIAERFLQVLDSPPVDPPGAESSDVEGLKTEIVALRAKRSRRLRDLAFRNARGVCRVCARDFSQLLNGRGVRALQVHHRRQLSAYKVPSRTTLADLAVVCANCHLLLHLDPAKSLRVEQLKRLLQRGGQLGA